MSSLKDWSLWDDTRTNAELRARWEMTNPELPEKEGT